MNTPSESTETLVERIDGLYAKATQGEWVADGTHEHGYAWLSALKPSGATCQVLDGQYAEYLADAYLVAALINAWPQIAAALTAKSSELTAVRGELLEAVSIAHELMARVFRDGGQAAATFPTLLDAGAAADKAIVALMQRANTAEAALTAERERAERAEVQLSRACATNRHYESVLVYPGALRRAVCDGDDAVEIKPQRIADILSRVSSLETALEGMKQDAEPRWPADWRLPQVPTEGMLSAGEWTWKRHLGPDIQRRVFDMYNAMARRFVEDSEKARRAAALPQSDAAPSGGENA